MTVGLPQREVVPLKHNTTTMRIVKNMKKTERERKREKEKERKRRKKKEKEKERERERYKLLRMCDVSSML
jgi:hypothetical protein